jgi:uncharacterized cupredoxin-like copper-binding protein
MRAMPIATLAAAALAIAGCGDDNDSNSSDGGGAQVTSSEGAAGNVKLSETEYKITPSDPSVDKAGTVTFAVSNEGQTTHALEVEGPGEEQKTDDIAPGDSTTLQVDLSKPGTYEFYCPIDGHKDKGMSGEIKVAGGGSGPSSDDDESSDSGSDDDSGGSGY